MKQEILNEKLPTMYELFQLANKADNPTEVIKKAIAKDGRVATVLGYAMNPQFKMGMPDGNPPYIPADVPLGLAEVELLHMAQSMHTLYATNVPRAKREIMLIQTLEKMAPQEAEMLVLIKDKALHTMLPNVTEAVLIASLGWSTDLYDKLKQKAS